MTPDRIANAIMQDNNFKGINVLVEGKKDIGVYIKFFNEEIVRLIQTNGKYKQRDAYNLLLSRKFSGMFFAIRDADFLRIKGNEKYDPEFKDNIFVTDGHDSEIMMTMFDALDDLLSISISNKKMSDFKLKTNKTIKELAIENAYIISCLRLANKKYNLGLSFKPEGTDGNKIKFKKFINKDSFSIDIDNMINIIHEYSKNRGKIVSPQKDMHVRLKEILNLQHNHYDMINGHDLSEIICVIVSQGLKVKSHIFTDSDHFEESLALSFERSKFKNTNLCKKIIEWQTAKNNINLFSE